MDVYLSDEELEREESLFEPSEPLYAPLDGRDYDIRSLMEHAMGYDLQMPPSSC